GLFGGCLDLVARFFRLGQGSSLGRGGLLGLLDPLGPGFGGGVQRLPGGFGLGEGIALGGFLLGREGQGVGGGLGLGFGLGQGSGRLGLGALVRRGMGLLGGGERGAELGLLGGLGGSLGGGRFLGLGGEVPGV